MPTQLLRTVLQMSPAEYAKLLGVDERTVSRWEAGRAIPAGCSAEVIAGLTEAFQRHPEREEELRAFIRRAGGVGGISYILVRLLDNAVERIPFSAR